MFSHTATFVHKGQVFEFREEALVCLDQANPTYITFSNGCHSPDTGKIIAERKENRILLAMVETKKEKIFGFDDEEDIGKLAADYPDAHIIWCYLNDNDK